VGAAAHKQAGCIYVWSLVLPVARRYTSGMNRRGVDIAALTPEERLSLLEQLWDSLTTTPEAIPLTEAQREELDRRLDDLEVDGPVGMSLAEFAAGVVEAGRRPPRFSRHFKPYRTGWSNTPKLIQSCIATRAAP
jgi:putative addiction module component (TIGR02574 family)